MGVDEKPHEKKHHIFTRVFAYYRFNSSAFFNCLNFVFLKETETPLTAYVSSSTLIYAWSNAETLYPVWNISIIVGSKPSKDKVLSTHTCCVLALFGIHFPITTHVTSTSVYEGWTQTIRTPFLHQTIRTPFCTKLWHPFFAPNYGIPFLHQTIRTFEILTSRKLSNKLSLI